MDFQTIKSFITNSGCNHNVIKDKKALCKGLWDWHKPNMMTLRKLVVITKKPVVYAGKLLSQQPHQTQRTNFQLYK